jgi:branched-chain amino acid transport system substrate-binding protein
MVSSGLRRSALALAGVLLVACGGSSQSGGQSNTTPIKIGYLVPLTGSSAAPGKNEQNGWNLGLHDFGDTVAGRKIETTFSDTAGDPNAALSDARSLVTVDNVVIVEGPLLANEQAAVASYLNALHMPVDDLSECAAINLADYAKYHNGFASGWNCDQPDLMAAEYLYNDLHLRHITTVGVDYAFGWESIGGLMTVFKKLGGTIDKAIWAPITTSDYSPYVTQIPQNTQAVFAVTVGAGGPRFTAAYQQFGLRAKIPLFGNTTVTDYSVLPSEDPNAITGVKIVAQYCDGITTPVNQKFADEYKATYGTYPGYYSEAGYTKARIAITALKALNGDTSKPANIVKALKSATIVAPRGPVKLNSSTNSPIQDIYVCEVRSVNGSLRNVPVKTYPNVQPWGPLSESEWRAHFVHDSAGRPSG